jgi:hypothetical protein
MKKDNEKIWLFILIHINITSLIIKKMFEENIL